MSETQQAPLPGWYDDGTGDGLVRWWNGRAWENNYQPAPKPIIPVRQYPKWFGLAVTAGAFVVLAVAYFFTPLRSIIESIYGS